MRHVTTMQKPGSPPVVHKVDVLRTKTVCVCGWEVSNIVTAKAEHERAVAVLEAVRKRKETA